MSNAVDLESLEKLRDWFREVPAVAEVFFDAKGRVLDGPDSEGCVGSYFACGVEVGQTVKPVVMRMGPPVAVRLDPDATVNILVAEDSDAE